MLAHIAETRRGDRRSGQRRFRGRLCATIRRRRRERAAVRRDRRRRAVDRGFHRRQGQSALSFDLALARIKAARAAIDKTGEDVMFTARTEGFIRGRPDIDETLRRLKAFADAGADCLYAPGIKTREEIETVVKAVAPKPVNFLIGWPCDLTVQDIAALGARRISVGGALARVAWGGFMRRRASRGRRQLRRLRRCGAGAELNGFFREDRPSGRAGMTRSVSMSSRAARPEPVVLDGRLRPGREARPGAARRRPVGRGQGRRRRSGTTCPMARSPTAEPVPRLACRARDARRSLLYAVLDTGRPRARHRRA